MRHVETLYPIVPATTRELSVALGDARAQLNHCEPPARVLAALQQSLSLPLSARTPKPVGVWQIVGQWVLRQRWSAVVATLLFVLVGGSVLEVSLPPDVTPNLASWGDDDGGFMSVANAAELQSGSTAWLVRTEMSRQQLISLGLPFDPARGAETVPAEVLLRPNGELLAVRLVR